MYSESAVSRIRSTTEVALFWCDAMKHNQRGLLNQIFPVLYQLSYNAGIKPTMAGFEPATIESCNPDRQLIVYG